MCSLELDRKVFLDCLFNSKTDKKTLFLFAHCLHSAPLLIFKTLSAAKKKMHYFVCVEPEKGGEAENGKHPSIIEGGLKKVSTFVLPGP